MTLTRESIGKFIALGGTFLTHQEEDDTPYRWPDVWLYPKESIINEDIPIEIPPGTEQIKAGSELTAVIGDDIHRASDEEAWDAIDGFTISNDVTASGEWPGLSDPNHVVTGTGYKIFPTFSPILSESVPKRDPAHYDDLGVRVTIDGRTAVDGSTSDLAFSIPEMVAHASKIFQLQAGDVIALGDPGNMTGYLDEAEQVSCFVESIGTLTNPITRL